MLFDNDNGYVADRSSESSEGGGSDGCKGRTNQYPQSLTTAPRTKERPAWMKLLAASPRTKERPVRVRFSSVRTVRSNHFDERHKRLDRSKDERMTCLCDMISQLYKNDRLKPSRSTHEDLTSCPVGKGWSIDKNIVTIDQALGFCGSPVLLVEAQSPYRVVHANAAYRSQFELPGNEHCSSPHKTLNEFLEANFGEKIVRVRQVRGDEDEALSHFLLDLFLSSDNSPKQVVA